MADYPTRGQRAPAYWDQTLKKYIDETAIAQGMTVALFGASITFESTQAAGTQDVPADIAAYHSFGTFSWANARLDHRLSLVANKGIGGNNSAMMLARVNEIINLDPRPALVIFGELGSNGILADTETADQIVANGEAILRAFLSAGIRVCIQTTAPNAAFTTTLRRTALSKVNAWTKRQAYRPGVVVADINSILTDASTGLPKANVLRDGSHYTSLGGRLAGEALYDALRPLVYGSADLASSNDDPYTLSANPMLIGNAGAKSGGITGDVATGWTAAPVSGVTAVCSLVARDDNIGGNWQRIVISGAGQVWLSTFVTTGFAPGDKVQFEAEIRCLSTWGSINTLTAQLLSSTSKYANDLQGEGLTQLINPPLTRGILRTPPMTVDAAVYYGGNVIFGGSSGTIDIGRVRVKKIV